MSKGDQGAPIQFPEPIDAEDVVYDPLVPGDWSPQPEDVQEALDQLAIPDKHNWKDSVRAATTAPGDLATDFNPGDTIDGVVLALDDRILLQDQADATENGIRVVAAAGAPPRSSDADTGDDLVSAVVNVLEGTANADKAFQQITDPPITLGVTLIVWVPFVAAGGGAQLVFGSANVSATTADRFLWPGNRDTPAPTTSGAAKLPMTRAGTLRNFYVFHGNGNGNGGDIIYTVHVNGAPTSMTVTIASTDETVFFDTSNSVVVAQTDIVTVVATKALAIGTSPSDVQAGMEYAA